MSSRVATAAAGVLASLAASLVLWQVFDFPFFFLAVPFVPFLFRRGTGDDAAAPPVRECPECGFRTRDPGFEFCPRDGTELQEP